MCMTLAAFTLVYARICLLAYFTMHVLHSILYVPLLEHDLHIFKLPQPIYQHAKYMRIIWFIHRQVQKSARSTQLAFIDSGSFCLVAFGKEAGFTYTFSLWYVTVLVISYMTLCTKRQRVVHLMEVTQAPSTCSF